MNISQWKYGKRLLFASTCLAGMLSVADAHAKEFDIKRNHVYLDGIRYFVKNSSSMKVGSYGDKKSPVTQQNYLARHADFGKTGGVNVTSLQSYNDISDTSMFHNGTFSMPIKLAKLKISSSVYASLVKQKKCSFVKEYVKSNEVLMRNLNSNQGVKNYLKQQNSSRIVHDVVRVKSCKIRNKTLHDVSIDGEVSLDALGIKLEGDDRTKGETEVTFDYGENTVIGYRLLKFDWDKKNKKKRTTIVGTKEDNQSFN